MSTEYSIHQHGFTFCRGVLSDAQCRELIVQLGNVEGAGQRGLLAEPSVRVLAQSEKILELVKPHLSQDPTPVRGIYFNKSPDANWTVTWHQDLTLALKRREDLPGFGPWSVKDGVPHVQPPVELLHQMLTVRIHLDPCNASNGALRVIPGSHALGRLGPHQIQSLRAERHEVVCEAAAGDVLLMKPLLLHASGKSMSPSHRRIIHLEYAGFQLPPPFQWAEAH